MRRICVNRRNRPDNWCRRTRTPDCLAGAATELELERTTALHRGGFGGATAASTFGFLKASGMQGTTVCPNRHWQGTTKAVTQVAEWGKTRFVKARLAEKEPQSAIWQNHKWQSLAEPVTQVAEFKGTTVYRSAKAVTQGAELEETTLGHLAEPQMAESNKSCHSSGKVRRKYGLPCEGTKPQERLLAEAVTREVKFKGTTVCRLAEPQVTEPCRSRHSNARVRKHHSVPSGRTTSGKSFAEAVIQMAESEGATVCPRQEPQVSKSCRGCRSGRSFPIGALSLASSGH